MHKTMLAVTAVAFASTIALTSLFTARPGFAAAATVTLGVTVAPQDCDTAQMLKTLDEFGAATPDADKLIGLGADIQEFNQKCNGIKFTGQATGVLGVIKFPAGYYMYKVTTRGALSITQKALGGESCSPSGNLALFTFQADWATEGLAETTHVRQGCTISFSVTRATLPFVFEIFPVAENAKLLLLTPTPVPTKKGK
jgi:hypothetical protein